MSETSMRDPRWRRLAHLRLYCNASCIAAVAVGCLVLCGWIFHIELLECVFLFSASIEVRTSLGLIFAGVSLWFLLPDPPRRVHRYWGLFFGALVTSIGTITVIEYVFGRDLRIDQLLFREGFGIVSVQFPERMWPVTAVTFLVLGLALLVLDWGPRRGPRTAQVLSLWSVFAAVMSVSGYLNGATAIYRIFSYTPIAVFTALVLFMIGAAVFFARPKVGIGGDLTGRFLGGAMARRFLPAVISVPILGAWIRARGQRAGLFGPELGLAWNVAINVVTLSLWYG